jgi:predicted ATPase
MADTIEKLTIEGFKSIRKLEDFQLGALNVLIGANGAGKTNFVSFFRFLRAENTPYGECARAHCSPRLR